MTLDVFQKHPLPPTWEWRKLGDICDVADRDHRTPAYQYGGVPLISPRDFTERGVDLSQLKHVAPAELDAFRKKCKPAKGDILYSRIGTIGEARVVDFDLDFVALHSIAMVKPRSPGLNSKYVLYLLQSPAVRSQAKHNIKSVGTPDLGLKRIKDFDVPLAPPPAQMSIVAEIEKQFSRLDEAVANLKRVKANLKRVKANLKRYKVAVLKAAVEGRLVPNEGELARREGRRYESGAQLLQGLVEERQAHRATCGKKRNAACARIQALPELPLGWAWASAEEVGRLQLGRQRSPQYHTGPDMRPYLRVQNVFEDRIDLSDVMEMNFSAADFERFALRPGDILLNEGQSPELLGRPAMYRGELAGACFTNTLIRFQAYRCVLGDFALIVFRHYMHAGRFVDEGTITTNIAHLSLGRLAAVEFPLPPLAEQHRIVSEVDRRLSIVREVEAEVDANLKGAQALRQAVLTRAFATAC